MNYTFTVTAQDVVGFVNPLITATFSEGDEIVVKKAWLNKAFHSDDIGNSLQDIVGDLFPKKSAPVNRGRKKSND